MDKNLVRLLSVRDVCMTLCFYNRKLKYNKTLLNVLPESHYYQNWKYMSKYFFLWKIPKLVVWKWRHYYACNNISVLKFKIDDLCKIWCSFHKVNHFDLESGRKIFKNNGCKYRHREDLFYKTNTNWYFHLVKIVHDTTDIDKNNRNSLSFRSLHK